MAALELHLHWSSSHCFSFLLSKWFCSSRPSQTTLIEGVLRKIPRKIVPRMPFFSHYAMMMEGKSLSNIDLRLLCKFLLFSVWLSIVWVGEAEHWIAGFCWHFKTVVKWDERKALDITSLQAFFRVFHIRFNDVESQALRPANDQFSPTKWITTSASATFFLCEKQNFLWFPFWMFLWGVEKLIFRWFF